MRGPLIGRLAAVADLLYRWRWRSAAVIVTVGLALALAGVHGWIDAVLTALLVAVFWVPVLVRWGVAVPRAGTAFREGLRGD
jgi:hypothetical protein